MAKRAIQNPERFIATVERNLAEYSHDIALILDKSWEASDAISDGLSQLLGISLLYSGKGTPRRDLVWVLNSAVRTPDRNLLQPAAAFPHSRIFDFRVSLNSHQGSWNISIHCLLKRQELRSYSKSLRRSIVAN